jgi:YD repeat-containing protein
MAWTNPITVVTGDIIPASYGNTYVRDNTRYLKGMDGAVSIDSGMNVAGALDVNGAGDIQTDLIVGRRVTVNAGNTTGEGIYLSDNGEIVDNNDAESSAFFRFNGGIKISAGKGNDTVRFHFNSDGKMWRMPDIIDNALFPGHMSGQVLTGFVRAGTWTYAYNGDGTLASQVMSGAGPLANVALTYEYSGGVLQAIRFRLGGVGGAVVQSIVYTYDGSGRISTEAHS